MFIQLTELDMSRGYHAENVIALETSRIVSIHEMKLIDNSDYCLVNYALSEVKSEKSILGQQGSPIVSTYVKESAQTLRGKVEGLIQFWQYTTGKAESLRNLWLNAGCIRFFVEISTNLNQTEIMYEEYNGSLQKITVANSIAECISKLNTAYKPIDPRVSF